MAVWGTRVPLSNALLCLLGRFRFALTLLLEVGFPLRRSLGSRRQFRSRKPIWRLLMWPLLVSLFPKGLAGQANAQGLRGLDVIYPSESGISVLVKKPGFIENHVLNYSLGALREISAPKPGEPR